MNANEIARFSRKYTVDTATGCWEWTGGDDGKGYGQFYRQGGIKVRAHRESFQHYCGEIPEAHVIDHLCRNHGCVNPAHLEAVTQRENVMRGEGVCAGYAKRTHCPNGHELIADNLTPWESGRRRCLTCHRVYMRDYKRKHKAAA